MFPGWKNYPASTRILANLSRWCVISLHGRRILFRSWEPCSVGTRSFSAAAGSHSTGSSWCWITFREIHEIACLNTYENGSSEESFQSIKLAVMPVIGILKHLIEVSKTFSAHSNVCSHFGISDTFVLYTQSILLINWKQVAPKYYNGKNAEEFLLTICTGNIYIKLAIFWQVLP